MNIDDFISYGVVSGISVFTTVAIFAETEPVINEEGEEEYSVKGYILLGGAFLIKWVIKKVINIIDYRRGYYNPNIIPSDGNKEKLSRAAIVRFDPPTLGLDYYDALELDNANESLSASNKYELHV